MRVGRYYWPPTDRHVACCGTCRWGRPYGTAEEADLAYAKHRCIISEKGAVMAGKSILTRAFEQLDAEVNEIVRLDWELNHNTDPEGLVSDALLTAKAKARGKAEILAMFMAPHFETADDIAAESGRRLAARQAGVAYETPGLTS